MLAPSSDEPPPALSWQQHLTVLLCGLGIFGNCAFIYQTPIFLDDAIQASLGLTEDEMVSSRSMIFVGWVFGSAPFGRLADVIGRKPVAAGCAVLGALHLLGCAAATGWTVLMASRLLGGISLGGMVFSFALAIDSVDERARPGTATLINLYNTASILLLVLVHVACARALALPWRLELCALAALLGAFVGAVALLVPSPPNGRAAAEAIELAELDRPASAAPTRREGATTTRAEASGGAEDDEGEAQALHPARADARSKPAARPAAAARAVGVGALLREQGALTAAVALCFVAAAVVWYTLNFQSGELSDSTEVNLVVLALLDLPGYKLAESLARRRGVGTRRATAALFAACGALLACMSAVAALGGDTRPLAFAGKTCAAGAFQLVYVLANEVFPPGSRGTAFGLCSTCARVASIFVPALAAKLSLGAASLVSAALALSAAAAAHAAGRCQPPPDVV